MNDFIKGMFCNFEKEAAAAPGTNFVQDTAQTKPKDVRQLQGSVVPTSSIGKRKMPLLPGQKAPAIAAPKPAAAPVATTPKPVAKKSFKPNAYQLALRKHKKGSAERNALVAQRKSGKKVNAFGALGTSKASKPIKADPSYKPKYDVALAAKRHAKQEERASGKKTSKPRNSFNMEADSKPAKPAKPSFDMQRDSRNRVRQNTRDATRVRRSSIASGGKVQPSVDAYANRQKQLNSDRAQTKRTSELSAKKRPPLVASL